MGGDIGTAWDVLLPLIMTGVTVGVVFAVVFGFVRIGWQYAPWICVAAFLIWFLG
jgi:hypothetical protein